MGEDVLHDGGLDDPRQVVVADQPVVVERHRLARPPEPLGGRDAGRQLVDDTVVEADHRQVRLRDDQVLVVAGVGDQRPAAILARAGADPGQVVTGLRPVRAGPDRVAGPQPHPVRRIEPGRACVGRTGAVQRVEVQRRRAALQQLGRRDVLAQADIGHVHRQVVVDELTEIGVAGRHVAVTPAALGHRLGQPQRELLRDRPAAWPHPREAERRRGGAPRGWRRWSVRLRDRVGLVAPASAELGVDHALALDEEGL